MTHTKCFNSASISIFVLGYFEFLITWLTWHIMNDSTIVTRRQILALTNYLQWNCYKYNNRNGVFYFNQKALFVLRGFCQSFQKNLSGGGGIA